MAIIRNPVLPGFHPDPCILRHNGWFYIATSTFEWWPGVQINRSRDLATWELAGYALTRRSQLDLRGVPDSGGVWAPALSFADGLFWLIYSDMKSFAGPFKDVRNYLITAPAIEGPWSDPVYLNASGFDPSLHHDTDGRKWLVNQWWRPSHTESPFAGIVLQEYSPQEKRLVGEPRKIFSGSALGTTEGPHLYRKDGFYYLITAEGGTAWTHVVTVARSRQIEGPYELSPHHPMLTSARDPQNPLQKSGHGSLVQDETGAWYLAHLCSRPVAETCRCVLGRETAVQPVEWPEGGWPRIRGGSPAPLSQFERPGVEGRPYFDRFGDDFSGPTLNPHWNTLREPPSAAWLTVGGRSAGLRLTGRHSLQSLFDQSLVACRVAHHACDVQVTLAYQPRSPLQRAGLAMYYNTANFYYLYVSADEQGMFLDVLTCDNARCREDRSTRLRLPADAKVELRASLRDAALTFHCRIAGGESRQVGGVFDATTLSDDYPLETNTGWAFTGLFAALCAQDAADTRLCAEFSSFRYEAVPFR